MKNPGTPTSGFVPMMTVLAQVSGQMRARGGGRGASTGRPPRGHRRGRRGRAAPDALSRGPGRGRRGRGPAARPGRAVRRLAVQRGAQPAGSGGAGGGPRLAGVRRAGELVTARPDRLGDGGQVRRCRRAGRDRRLPPRRTPADDPGRLRDRRHLHGGETQARRGHRGHRAQLAGQPVGPGRGGGLERPVRRLHRFPPPGAPGVRRVGHLPGRAEHHGERLPAVRRHLPDLPGRPGRSGRPARARAGGAVVRARPGQAGRSAAAGPGKRRDGAGRGGQAADRPQGRGERQRRRGPGPARGRHPAPALCRRGTADGRALAEPRGRPGRPGGVRRHRARPAAAQRRRQPSGPGRGQVRGPADGGGRVAAVPAGRRPGAGT